MVGQRLTPGEHEHEHHKPKKTRVKCWCVVLGYLANNEARQKQQHQLKHCFFYVYITLSAELLA